MRCNESVYEICSLPLYLSIWRWLCSFSTHSLLIYLFIYFFLCYNAFKAIFVISIYNYIYRLSLHGLHGNRRERGAIKVVVGEWVSKRETHSSEKKHSSIFLSQFFPLSAVFRCAYSEHGGMHLYIDTFICNMHRRMYFSAASVKSTLNSRRCRVQCAYTQYLMMVTTTPPSQATKKSDWCLGLFSAFI